MKTAKLTNRTLTLLTELDFIEEGTLVYRALRRACNRKATVDCKVNLEQNGFDTIELQTRKNKITITLPIFVQNKLTIMPKKDLANFKKSENALFQTLRSFYREATDERVIDVIFDTQFESKR